MATKHRDRIIEEHENSLALLSIVEADAQLLQRFFEELIRRIATLHDSARHTNLYRQAWELREFVASPESAYPRLPAHIRATVAPVREGIRALRESKGAPTPDSSHSGRCCDGPGDDDDNNDETKAGSKTCARHRSRAPSGQ